MSELLKEASQLLALRWLDAACWTVRQQQQMRYLYKDQQCQSQLHCEQPATLIYPHLRWLADNYRADCGANGLLIGIGGGDWLRYCASLSPQPKWTAVDNQAHLLDWLEQYFFVQAQGCTVANGLDFLQSCVEKYDFIFIDLFPWPNQWQPLVELSRQRLKPHGRLAINITAEQPWEVVTLLATSGLSGQHFQAQGYQNRMWLSHCL